MTFTIEGSPVTSTTANIEKDDAKTINVKAQYKEDIRRFNFSGNASIALLKARIQTVYSIPAEVSISLFYRDEDNDIITMTLDDEFQHAIQLAKGLLRLEVRASTPPVAPTADVHAQPTAPAWVDAKLAKKMWKAHHKGKKPHKWGMPPPPPGFAGPFEAAFPFGHHGPHGGFPHHGPHHHGPHHHGHHYKAKHHGKAGESDHEHGCHKDKLKARHVKDVTIPDGTQIVPGTPFVKTWRVRNVGVDWPAGSRLIFISHKGDHMGGPEFVPVEGPVLADAEVDISVNLQAPVEPGNYSGFWRMATEDGKKFGQRLWVSITVTGNSSSSDDGGFEHIVVPSEYEDLCVQVEEMGFEVPRRRVEHLLRKFGGNVNTVADILSSGREGHRDGHGKRGGGIRH